MVQLDKCICPAVELSRTIPMIPPEVEALVQDRSRYERSARRVVDHANNICTEVNCWPSIIKLLKYHPQCCRIENDTKN